LAIVASPTATSFFRAVDPAEHLCLDDGQRPPGLHHFGAAGEAVAGRGRHKVELVFRCEHAALRAVEHRRGRRGARVVDQVGDYAAMKEAVLL